MGRRGYPQRITCADPGCQETATRRHEFRRDYDAGVRDQRERPWKCSRHDDPDAYLRPGNESTSVTLVASRVPFSVGPPGFLTGLSWLPEGQQRSGSGRESGPGFIACADEFPEGTRLIVTTQVLPPKVAHG